MQHFKICCVYIRAYEWLNEFSSDFFFSVLYWNRWKTRRISLFQWFQKERPCEQNERILKKNCFRNSARDERERARKRKGMKKNNCLHLTTMNGTNRREEKKLISLCSSAVGVQIKSKSFYILRFPRSNSPKYLYKSAFLCAATPKN